MTPFIFPIAVGDIIEPADDESVHFPTDLPDGIIGDGPQEREGKEDHPAGDIGLMVPGLGREFDTVIFVGIVLVGVAIEVVLPLDLLIDGEVIGVFGIGRVLSNGPEVIQNFVIADGIIPDEEGPLGDGPGCGESEPADGDVDAPVPMLPHPGEDGNAAEELEGEGEGGDRGQSAPSPPVAHDEEQERTFGDDEQPEGDRPKCEQQMPGHCFLRGIFRNEGITERQDAKGE